MRVVEFADLEIGGAAERYRTSVTKYLPKPLRTRYRGGRARAVNGFTSRDATISEIEGQSHERNDLCHSRCSCAPTGNSRFGNRRKCEDFRNSLPQFDSGWHHYNMELDGCTADVRRAPIGPGSERSGPISVRGR